MSKGMLHNIPGSFNTWKITIAKQDGTRDDFTVRRVAPSLFKPYVYEVNHHGAIYQFESLGLFVKCMSIKLNGVVVSCESLEKN